MLRSLGNNIRKIREIKNFSQNYMADKLLISQSSYSDMENCKTSITEERLEEIAQILGVSSETIKNFNDQVVFNACSQSGYFNVNNLNYSEKIEALYKELLQSKDEIISQLKKEIEVLKQINSQG